MFFINVIIIVINDIFILININDIHNSSIAIVRN